MRPGSTTARDYDLPGAIWTLVRTDFKVRYHGTFMGFFWALLKPAAMFLVLMGVFHFIFSAHGRYAADLLIGLCLWDFFAEGTKVGLTSLLAKGFLVEKTKFPRWILVVTSISNAGFTAIVVSAVLLGWLALSGHAPGPLAILLYLAVLVQLALIVIGFSLGTSALFLRYRDLNQLWDVAIQAGFFLAPVVYPLGIVPERFHGYFYLWPPTPLIQFSRELLVQGRIPTLRAFALLAGMTLAVLGIGILLFRRHAPSAAEHL